MQNCYVCDIGDFGKYGLLKSLCLSGEDDKSPELSLGVVWYLVPNDSNKNDGMHTEYLNQSPENKKFRNCDPKLYDGLADIFFHKERNILQIQESNILPQNTSFYDKTLTFTNISSNGPKGHDKRLAIRRKWVQEAFDETANCDLVFFDPDTGLEIKSIKSHEKYGPKYTFFEELTPYLQRNQSLIIYQHTGHHASAEKQINTRFTQINKYLKGYGCAFALRFHRGTSRVFFIVSTEKHKNIIYKRARHFIEGPWKEHFTLYNLL